METFKIPPSQEVTDHQANVAEDIGNEAKELYEEHRQLAESRQKAVNNMYAASTAEDRLTTGKVVDEVISLGKENVAAAKAFADENLVDLKDEAMFEAAVDGVVINEFKEKPALRNFNAAKHLDDMNTALEAGRKVHTGIKTQLEFIVKYSEAHGFDPSNLSSDIIDFIKKDPDYPQE